MRISLMRSSIRYLANPKSPHAESRPALAGHPFLRRLLLAATIVLFFALLSRAGGPRNIAGTSYFEATATGQPLTWPQGVITYYTDQGDLSPILPNVAANAFVADAFSQWTAVSTAALAINSGGQLAEDVNGSNVIVNSDGTISLPTDIQPTAISTPVGIVYDYDGSVTDALLGAGAGGTGQCFFNAVYGGDDSFGESGSYQHALIVINGQCAQESSQLVEVEYRLVRVIGSVLGVNWSQVNSNVQTGTPPPTADDYAGFPVMHYTDPVSCIPITRCYTNPYQLAPDDMAAVSRLYAVTAQNQSNFTGKLIFSAATARIHGSVWFTDLSGDPTQPMQGANVVARWMDPKTHLPSRSSAASSVSGFLFTGNAGNAVTGYLDALGDPFDEWGSNSPSLEGFFDLAGLVPPNGGIGEYQLTVEPLDSTWSAGVGPYAPFLVTPSGLGQSISVTVDLGQDVEQDILMANSAQPMPQPASVDWATPTPVPASGGWTGSLSGYGDMGCFLLQAQANRTLSIAVTAVDESGKGSESKAQPVIGMWAASDPEGTAPPAFTPSAFNTLGFGLTRLNAQIATSTNFLIGISDLRGDGRPDYHYDALVLYADSVAPARVSTGGGPVIVKGMGFSQGLTATIGGLPAAPLEVNAEQMILAAPAFSDGPQTIAIVDPVSGNSTTMINALTFGAAANDTLILTSGNNPSTPVGAQASSPMSVRVLAADGVTPVAGATIGWGATNGLQLSACGGAPYCSVTTDQSGNASTWLTPSSPGTATTTATLAPGVYSSGPAVSTSLNATETAAAIGTIPTYMRISQGATTTLPLTARVMSEGVGINDAQITFTIVGGSGTLSAPSVQSSSSGYAAVSLTVTQISAPVQVSACLGPANVPCAPFYINPVPIANQKLQPIAGAGQIASGQLFQPIVVEVTDSSSPPNPVIAAPVEFLTTVLRPGGASAGGGLEMPVILSVSQSSATTDTNGMASITPATGGFSPPLEVDVGVMAGTAASLDFPLEMLPVFVGVDGAISPSRVGDPVRIRRPIATEK